jgi:hypothetical protein
MEWWSAAVDEGGPLRPEPSLEGRSLAWAGPHRLTADREGRVVATVDGQERVLADERPDGCADPEPEQGLAPTLAGSTDWAVVSFQCLGGSVTVAYDLGRAATLSVPDASVVSVDGHEALLSGARRTYLLDLEQEQLTDIGHAPHEGGGTVKDDLVLWNVPGHLDDDDVYDVSYSVARIP